MRSTSRLAAATLAWLFIGASSAAAHIGGSAFILTTSASILPGQKFEVVAADMGADADVLIEIESGARRASLGTVRAAGDGHFIAELTLPADFPSGDYAQLFASVAGGQSVSSWVYVGESSASAPSPPGPAQSLLDPSVLVLVAFALGVMGVLGYLFLKRGKPAPRPAAAQTVPLTRSRSRKRRAPN